MDVSRLLEMLAAEWTGLRAEWMGRRGVPDHLWVTLHAPDEPARDLPTTPISRAWRIDAEGLITEASAAEAAALLRVHFGGMFPGSRDRAVGWATILPLKGTLTECERVFT
jgi:hypothetical protein